MLKVQELPFIYGLPHNYWERCDTRLRLEARISAGIVYGWGKPFYTQANDRDILKQAALCKIKPFICLFVRKTPVCQTYMLFAFCFSITLICYQKSLHKIIPVDPVAADWTRPEVQRAEKSLPRLPGSDNILLTVRLSGPLCPVLSYCLLTLWEDNVQKTKNLCELFYITLYIFFCFVLFSLM